MWQGIKLAGNKVWSGAKIRLIHGWHEIWFWKNVYHSWLNYYYYACSSLFNLHSCILSILFFSIPDNVYTISAVYFYFHWKSLDVLKQVLTYKEEPSEELIDIGLSEGCEYMLAYQNLTMEFVSYIYVVLILSYYT